MSDKLDKQQLAALMERSSPEDGVKLLAGLPAKEACDLLLEHPEPRKVVELIPIEHLYVMMHEIGVEDALVLLDLASPEQVQGFIDIDCWDHDRLSLAKARTWMLLLNETDDQAFLADLKQMDFALLVCFFRMHVEVHKVENPDDEIPQEAPAFVTPDGRYLVVFTASLSFSELINALLYRIFVLDFEFFSNLLEAIYWETPSEVEETAYIERLNRLESRGFPDFYASLEILATVDVERFVPGHKVAPSSLAEAPGAKISGSDYLVRYEHHDTLLRRVLAENFPARDETAVEIMGLANMAVVADQASFVDLERVRRLVARTDGFLNIGLEYLAGGDPARAREALTQFRALDIHKIGRSLVVALARRARKLLPRVAVDGRSPDQLLLDGPERDLIYGLLQKDLLRINSEREELWTELAQVRAAEEQLGVIERFVALMHDELGFAPDTVRHLVLMQTNIANPAELTYRVLFNTFRCHDLLGRKPAPTPLTRADLDALADRLESGPCGARLLPAAAQEALQAWLAAHAAEPIAPLWAILERYGRALAAELARADFPAHLRQEVLTKVV